MRIFINALAARQGGGVTYLNQFLQVVRQRADLEVYIFGFGLIDSKLLESKNIQVIPVKWAQKNLLTRFIAEKFYFPFWLWRHKIDIAFFPSGMVSGYVPRDIPAVTMFRNMMPFDHALVQKYPLAQRLRLKILFNLYRKSYQTADCVIFISHYAREVVKRYIPAIENRSCVIPHGVAESFRGEGKLPVEGYILYVSVFYHYKHQVEVVKGLALFRKQFGYAPKLKLVGYLAPYAEQVRQVIAEEHLEDCVDIVGPLSYAEQPEYYKKAKLVVFASSCENCPNILLEGMASGRPIICSQTQPMPEFLGRHGIYFDPLCPESFCQALAQYVALSDIEKQTLADNVYHQSLQYSWQTTVSNTIEQFYKLRASRSC